MLNALPIIHYQKTKISSNYLEVTKKNRIFAASKEDFAERMTTFMAFVVVSSLKNKPSLFGRDGFLFI